MALISTAFMQLVTKHTVSVMVENEVSTSVVEPTVTTVTSPQQLQVAQLSRLAALATSVPAVEAV